MRYVLLGLAAFAIAGCDRSASDSDTSAGTLIAVSYDGAYYDTDTAKLAHGERLSYVLGCRACHTAQLTGQSFPPEAEQPTGIYSANLTRAMERLTDDQFETILRTGKHPEGRDLFYMPAQNYRHLSERDMDALIAHLRQLEPEGEDIVSQPTEVFLESRTNAEAIQTSEQMVAQFKDKAPPELGEKLAQGRYVAMTACAECHAADLNGYPGFTPPLTVSSAYDDTQFRELLTTGTSFDGRNIGLMGFIGGFAYSRLTEGERDQIIAYVRGWTEWKMEQSE